jgi:hypothetical protein
MPAGGWPNIPIPVTSAAISRLDKMCFSGRYILTSSFTAPDKKPLEVLRVLHGNRDVTRILG